MKYDSYKSVRQRLNFQFQSRWFFANLAIDAVLWVGFAYFMMQPLHLAWMATIPFAVLMFRNFTWMHEAVHGAGHSNKKMNYIVGVISGSICFLPYHLWRAIHLDHHYWAGNYEMDPAFEVVKRYPDSSKLMKGVFALMWRTRFPLMAFFQYIVFWAHSALLVFKKKNDFHTWFSFLSPVILWTGFVLSLSHTQAAVVAGGIFLYSLLFDFINLPHHVGIYNHKGETRIPIWEQHEASRSCRYPAWVEHLVMNFNFHAEHHMFPALPWHELRHAHSLLGVDPTNSSFFVIKAGWLARQRRRTFAQFLRPDLYPIESQDTEKPAKAA